MKKTEQLKKIIKWLKELNIIVIKNDNDMDTQTPASN